MDSKVLKSSSRPNRLIGGKTSTIRNFPYIVALELSDGPSFFCGGSILSPYHIITAAHCFIDETSGKIQVRSGSPFMMRGGSVHPVLNLTIHPEYNSITYINDLAILQLHKPIRLNKKNKKSISIFEFGEESKSGSIATVVGWGCVDDNKTMAYQLRSLNVTILDKKDCGYSNAKQRRICSSGLSADNKTRGVCFGDSGGPLVIDGKLAGIVSTIADSSLHNNEYTEVSRYRKWIDRTIGVTIENEKNDNSGIKEFPYLVALEWFGSFTCGGVIISPRYVITEAICVDYSFDPNYLQIRAGSSFTEEGGSRHRVLNFTLNEEFYNLALVLLKDPIVLDNITKSSIPMFEINEKIKNGSIAKTAGWGCPIVDNMTLSEHLRGLDVSIIGNENDCHDYYEYWLSAPKEDQQLCVFNFISVNSQYHELCEKDAGNPLVIGEKLAGIVSPNSSRPNSELYQFMDIANNRKWIDQTVEILNNLFIKKEIEESAIKQFPYLVSLEYMSKFICGGTIISPYYVLSSVRCVGTYPSLYQIRAGSSYREKGGSLYSVSDFEFQGELTLLELENPIELDNETKSTINVLDFFEDNKNGYIATTAGWGCTKKNESDAKVLQSYNMKIVNDKYCMKTYENHNDSLKVEEACACVFSANNKTYTPCSEDFGNPVVVDGKLFGVVSWQTKINHSKFKRIVEVAHYRNWMDEMIAMSEK